MCYSTTRSLRPGLSGFHWAACCRLVSIEGYTTTAMWTSHQKKDPTLFPWVFLLITELTIAQSVSANLYEDQKTWRQLQKLGEVLDTMHQPWSSWSDLLPSSCFDRSAQHHTVTQLSRCITAAAQVRHLCCQHVPESTVTPDLHKTIPRVLCDCTYSVSASVACLLHPIIYTVIAGCRLRIAGRLRVKTLRLPCPACLRNLFMWLADTSANCKLL